MRQVVSLAGGRVRRPVYAWTPTVHALLGSLHAAGVVEVPVPLGLTAEYEEVSFLRGDAGADCWPHQATDSGLRSAGRLLRRIHDATVGWVPPAGAVWGLPARRPEEVVCHGDPGPWNMVWNDGAAVGLFDGDFCHPGPRVDDVAYALEYLAPFRDDAQAQRWHGFSSPPDRAGRISAFCEAYGISSVGVVDVVTDVQRRGIDHVRMLAEAGVHPQVDWVADGHLDELAARVAWSQNHRDLFT